LLNNTKVVNVAIERDTEILIDNQLKNLGWDNNPHSPCRNVYQQRPKTPAQRRLLNGLKPDYVLYASDSSEPLAVIEAKKPGENIHRALEQGLSYAKRLDAPLVFASDGVFTKTIHARINRPLTLNGEEIDELIRETLAIRYMATNTVTTLDKKVVKSRGELISIFSTVNDLLREEGLQKGLSRWQKVL
jgi:type I restriction enzyme M protein